MDPLTPPTPTSASLPVAGYPEPASVEAAQQLPSELPKPFAEPAAERLAKSRKSNPNTNPYAPPAPSTDSDQECVDRAAREETERLFKLAHGFRFFSMCYPVFVLLVAMGFYGSNDIWGWAIFPFMGMWLASIGMVSRSMRPLEALVCVGAHFIPCICILPMILSYQMARTDLIRNGATIELFGPPRSYLQALKQGHQPAIVSAKEGSSAFVYIACAFLAFIAGLLFFLPT